MDRHLARKIRGNKVHAQAVPFALNGPIFHHAAYSKMLAVRHLPLHDLRWREKHIDILRERVQRKADGEAEA